MEFYTPVGMLLHDIVQRLGEAHFVEVIQDALLHSRSPKLLKDLGAVGIGDEAWSWAVYEALATRADDPEMRRIAGASLRALTYSGRGYLNFEPKTAFGHYCRGCAYYRGGARSGLSIEQSLRAAMSELDQAIEADQEHHEASVAKAEVLKRMGRAQEALAILDETIRQTPDDADAIATRASVWRKIGNRERAEADAATATAIRERERQTFLQTQEGLLQTMAEVDQDATTTILLAADNKEAGQYRAMALDDYDDILKHHAAECSVYYLRRALFHWYFGDGEAALRDTTAFLDKQPRASYGHYLLARILAARNDAQGSAAAQREYQALVAINALPVVAPPATPTQLPLTDLNFYTATDLAEKGEPGSIIKIAQALAASNGDCMTRMVAADALGESFDPQDVAPVISYIEMTYGRVVDDPKFEPKAHIFKLVAKLKLASGPGFLAAAATADSGAISTDAAGQAIEALATYPVQT
ncbi:MAG: tetratricopeptide repeat protein, partial [Armatimonadota bacterium]